MKNVLWFEELSRASLAEAGGKGANLGEMTAAGFPVPPGFVVTSGAYFKYLDANNLRGAIGAILENLDVNDNDKLNESSEKIQKLIMDWRTPEDIKIDILHSYKKICDRAQREVYVAVRSSA